MRLFTSIFFICITFFIYPQVNAFVPKDTLIKKQKAFNAGDVVISPNYGYPQVNAAVIRTAIKVYYKYIPDQTMSFSLSNSGVFNAKAEYGIMQTLGLGFAVSYWDMDLKIQNNYNKNGVDQVDEINLKLTALGLGLRGNYHLVEDLETKMIDPYFGFTLGTTKYTKDLTFTSTNTERQIPEWVPERLYKLKDGWASYISSTFGVRIYPVKYVGLNFEAGWDKGALLFGGVVFNIPTKAVKAFE